jgi:hypothetical protein
MTVISVFSYDHQRLIIAALSAKRTITSHLNSLNIKKTTAYDVGIPGSGLGQAQKYGRIKPVNRVSTLIIW